MWLSGKALIGNCIKVLADENKNTPLNKVMSMTLQAQCTGTFSCSFKSNTEDRIKSEAH